MKFIKNIFVILLIFISVNEISAQINNQKVEKIKVYGNCNMCKETIENAGSETNVSAITWDSVTKIATITYDDTKTSLNTILKKIAKSGYSNEKYKAKNSDYKKLPLCCQY
ncbi:MAG: cation transporter [Apibacter sp.]|jgi:periplasmic mercuric ion binding protein|nr:cation transporter [Apibacter sp.]